MRAVRTSLEPFTKLRLEDELRKTREKVCEECELKESCVNEILQADETFDKRIAEDVRCGRLGTKSFSDNFETTCYCSEKIIREFNKSYFVYRTNVTAQNKMNRVQSLAGSQFKTFGGVIGSACATLEKLSTAEKSPSDALMLSAKEFGLDVRRADICLDKAGRDYFENVEKEIMICLAGKAATELILNDIDLGVSADLRAVNGHLLGLLDENAAFGFKSYQNSCQESSDHMFEYFETVKEIEIARYYINTKQFLSQNRKFLEACVEKLIEKRTLSYKDIATLREMYLGSGIAAA